VILGGVSSADMTVTTNLLSVPGKVFAHVLLSRVIYWLQERRIQHNGFAPGRLTFDRLVMLNSQVHSGWPMST